MWRDEVDSLAPPQYQDQHDEDDDEDGNEEDVDKKEENKTIERDDQLYALRVLLRKVREGRICRRGDRTEVARTTTTTTPKTKKKTSRRSRCAGSSTFCKTGRRTAVDPGGHIVRREFGRAPPHPHAAAGRSGASPPRRAALFSRFKAARVRERRHRRPAPANPWRSRYRFQQRRRATTCGNWRCTMWPWTSTGCALSRTT